MKKNIIILGSTGSIGKSSLSAIYNKKNYKVSLLSQNQMYKNYINRQFKTMSNK